MNLIGLIASIGGALIGGRAARRSDAASAEATRYATDASQRNFEDIRGLLQPQIAAGDTARSSQLGLLGLPGGVSYQEAMSRFKTSPGYDFLKKSGQEAVQGSAAAGGRLFSGKTLRDLTRFGTGLADQEFSDYYGRLGGLAGGGAGAVGQQVSAGSTNAMNLGNLALGRAADRTSSYVARANAGIGGLQNLADLYAYYRSGR